MPDQPEWYRAWRHEQREFEQRLAASPRLRRIEAVKRFFGIALLGAGTIFVFLPFHVWLNW